MTNNTPVREPDRSTGLEASPGNALVDLEWAQPEYNGGSAITKYQYQEKVGTGSYGVWTDVPDSGVGGDNETSYTLTRINDTTYTYRVRAVNAQGESDASGESSATPVEGPGVRFSPTELDINEGGEATYTVKLAKEPTHNVTVYVSTTSGLSRSPSSLSFSTTNWNEAQTVTLTAGHDSDIEDETGQATHRVSSSDSGYHNLEVDPVEVSITDDDSRVEITAGQAQVNEGQPAPFTLTRTGNTSEGITVNLRVSQSGQYLDPGETTGNRTVAMDSGATSLAVDIATDNDTNQESGGSITVQVNSGTEYFLGSARSATVNVADDDGPPGVPDSLTPEAQDEQVALTWTTAPSPSSAIEKYSYRVRRSDRSSWTPDWTDIENSGPGTVSYTATGLTNGQEYILQVRATNATGDGDPAEVTATPFGPPGIPAINVTPVDGELRITWTVDDDGGKPVNLYQVEW